jgi:NADPH:quinone reductase-like Zn-dependent oxidoreductase
VAPFEHDRCGSSALEEWGVKAIVCRRYGSPDVLEVRDVPKPTAKDDEILIKVRATTVTSGDWRVRSGTVPRGFGVLAPLALGISGPRQPILGTELAGDVESVGKNVRRFKVGDPVFAFTGTRMGCYVEYKCIPESGPVALKPANLTYEESAALSFGGATALVFLRKGGIQKGDKVLVNGASGGVGTAAVQLAKHFGAEVTGVSSAANLELVKSLGADKVIDYNTEDFTRGGEVYDIIIDAVGTAPFARSGAALKDGGRLLLVLGTLSDTVFAPWVSMTTRKRVIAGVANETPENVRVIAQLAGAGALRPVIDRRYSFGEIVEAHRYVDAGHKRGNVVIRVADGLDAPRLGVEGLYAPALEPSPAARPVSRFRNVEPASNSRAAWRHSPLCKGSSMPRGRSDVAVGVDVEGWAVVEPPGRPELRVMPEKSSAPGARRLPQGRGGPVRPHR